MPGQKQSQPRQPKDFEEEMTWKLRWFLIITITIIYTLSLIAGLIGYWIAKDNHYLFFITPATLIPFVRLLFPPDQQNQQRRHEEKLAKINAQKELSELRARVKQLEAKAQRKTKQPVQSI